MDITKSQYDLIFMPPTYFKWVLISKTPITMKGTVVDIGIYIRGHQPKPSN